MTTLPLTRLRELLERAKLPFPLRGGRGAQVWGRSPKLGDSHVLDIRGWGELTGGGHGALGLPHDEARAIQDARAELFSETINALPALLDALSTPPVDRAAIKHALWGMLDILRIGGAQEEDAVEATVNDILALSTPPVGGLDREAVARIIENAMRHHVFIGDEDGGPDLLDALATWMQNKTVAEAIDHVQTIALAAAVRICALATPQWLPIPADVDTSKAPFDGEPVDLWVHSPGISTGPARVPDCWFYGDKWWRVDLHYGDDQGRAQVHNATHYMPLPEPPK